MQQGYFARSWAAFRSTPHWMGKLIVLGLVSLIPIFGAIVVCGYLWGWARDAAWGVENPMPEHVFGNEDGRLYSRGFFALAIIVLLSFIPTVFSFAASVLFGVTGSFAAEFVSMTPFWGLGAFGAMAVGVAVFVLSFAVIPVSWVCVMRMSVYGRFSAGFSVGRIWAMIRRDPVGLVKIFAIDIIGSIAVSLAVGLLSGFLVVLGLAGGSVLAFATMDAGSAATAMMLMGVGLIALLVLLAVALFSACAMIFVQALVCRAMGYWTAQFAVPMWGGQNDPMPFEVAA